MCNFKKCKEKLHDKSEFYSSLSGKGNSDNEYQLVLKVENKFEMKTMKIYHGFYLKCGVLLLADEFENFRNRCLENYGLCSSHYSSAPALSWDAMLSMPKLKLDLIAEVDMNLFFDKAMAAGVFRVSKRYSKANNKYSTSYDPKNR